MKLRESAPSGTLPREPRRKCWRPLLLLGASHGRSPARLAVQGRGWAWREACIFQGHCVCVCVCVRVWRGRAGVWIAEKRKRAWKTHVFTVTCAVPCGVLQRQEHKAGAQFVLLTPRGRKDRPSQSTNCELKCLPGGEIYILKTFFRSDFI